MDGLAFLIYLRRNGAQGILGDEMGLGKTLQILSFFQHVVENEETTTAGQAPFLVVCPLSVLRSWTNEASKWTELRVIEYHGSAEKKVGVRKMLSKRGIHLDILSVYYWLIIVSSRPVLPWESSGSCRDNL
jgi:SWI/SNF-related matrix-associated actin-dependent regulator of chromatin subfamily A member 5